MDRNQYKWTFVMSITSGLVIMIFVFAAFMTPIVNSIATVEGIWDFIIVTLIRICIVTGMALFMIRKWFKQEEQYLSDLPFLFGVFFLILIFAKLLDILYGLTFYTAEPDAVFSIIKIRFLIAIVNLLPMLYLSIGMLLYYLSLKEKYKGYSDNTKLDKTRVRILIVVIFVEILAVALAPDYSTIVTILPLMVIPSLIMIVWLFVFAYKNKRLSQVHPLIIAIGFLIYLFSTIARPILQKSLDIATYVIVSESFEIFCFTIIFIGLLVNVKYKV